MSKFKIKVVDHFHIGNRLPEWLHNIYEFEYCDDPDFLFYFDWGFDHLKYNCTKIHMTYENLSPRFWECDFAIGFEYLNNKRFLRWPVMYSESRLQSLIEEKDEHKILSLKSKFCHFTYSNPKPRKRIEFYNQLSKYKRVDALGILMNNQENILPKSTKSQDIFKQYKFTIAFENCSYPGYTTEKIFNAFFSNTVPIYWGNPAIVKDVNSKSFINCHDFRNLEEVVKHVIEVDQNDDLYLQYLSEPCFIKNEIPQHYKKENIVKFFDSIFNSDKKPVSQTWKRAYQKIRYNYFKLRYRNHYNPFLPFEFLRYSKLNEWYGRINYYIYNLKNQ